MRPGFVALVVGLLSTLGFIASASVLTAVSAAATVNDTTVGTASDTFAYAGSWSTSTQSAGKYQGDDHYSSTTGSSYTFRFTAFSGDPDGGGAIQVALFGAMAPHHGQASVQIDGGPAVTIDQYAGTRQDNVLIYMTPLLEQGAHSVKVTVKGTRQSASTGNVIAIDRADSIFVDETQGPCGDAVLEPSEQAGQPVVVGVPSATPLSLCNPCHCGGLSGGDSIRFNAVAGTTYRLETQLGPIGGIALYGPDGSEIARDDSYPDLLISFTAASSGVYRLSVYNNAPEYGDDYILRIAEAAHRVSVAKSGTGSGNVTSQPAGINCGATCSASFAKGAKMTLTAAPAAGSVFSGWSGACSGTSTTCTLSVNARLSATASFAATSTTVNDTVVGTTSGTFAYAGSWATSTGAGKYLGNDHYSSTAGSSYTFRFSGTKVALYGAKASHHGQASVQIDGGTAVTIDQHAATRQDNVLVYQSPALSLGAHSVKVTVKGTHQAASTGNVIAIDRATASG